MATLQLGSASHVTPSINEAGRRRATRYPAGWLTVEAETTSGGRKLPGRLLDTSAGGLGLVLDDEVLPGSVVRVQPGVSDEPVQTAFWHGRRARVAYAVPLPGGSWRVGLTFLTAAHGDLQIWGTRLLLLAVFVIASVSALFSDLAGSIAGVALGAIAVTLCVGAEWQHFAEQRAGFYGPPNAIAKR